MLLAEHDYPVRHKKGIGITTADGLSRLLLVKLLEPFPDVIEDEVLLIGVINRLPEPDEELKCRSLERLTARKRSGKNDAKLVIKLGPLPHKPSQHTSKELTPDEKMFGLMKNRPMDNRTDNLSRSLIPYPTHYANHTAKNIEELLERARYNLEKVQTKPERFHDESPCEDSNIVKAIFKVPPNQIGPYDVWDRWKPRPPSFIRFCQSYV